MRSSNPVFSDKIFAQERAEAHGASKVMTVDGTIHKTGFLLTLLLLAAGWTWGQVYGKSPDAAMPFIIGGLVGGMVFGIAGCFMRRALIVIAPLYAIFEGLLLGGISALLEAQYPGIAMQAAGLTFATLFGMLALYRSGIITVTDKFRMGVMAATSAVFLLYLASFILGMFGVNVPFIHEGGAMGIGISLVIVVIAALNLALDFDFIDRGAKAGLPKHMEWYGAFGLLVTLVWLYIEFLRLLSKIRSR